MKMLQQKQINIFTNNMRDFSKKTINIVMVESKKSKMTFADFKKLTD